MWKNTSLVWSCIHYPDKTFLSINEPSGRSQCLHIDSGIFFVTAGICLDIQVQQQLIHLKLSQSLCQCLANFVINFFAKLLYVQYICLSCTCLSFKTSESESKCRHQQILLLCLLKWMHHSQKPHYITDDAYCYSPLNQIEWSLVTQRSWYYTTPPIGSHAV